MATLLNLLDNELPKSFRETAQTTLTSISAVNTLLNRYPILEASEAFINKDGQVDTMSFMISILKMIPLKDDDGKPINAEDWLLDKLCKMLCGTEGKGDNVMDIIEVSIKSILMANIKDFLTCSINPLIPDSVLLDSNNFGANKGTGIKVYIDDIDIYNLLRRSPFSKKGKLSYFDVEKHNMYEEGNANANTPYLPPYSVSDVWKSCDFNAYLWYIINRQPKNAREHCWDNRVNLIKKIAQGSKHGIVRRKKSKPNKDTIEKAHKLIFTRSELSKKPSVEIQIDDKKYKNYDIIYCTYREANNINDRDYIEVFLNPNRYKREWSVNFGFKKPKWLESHKSDIKDDKTEPNGSKENIIKENEKFGFNMEFELNKTLFEFNYEYIYSLKLFETKTLISNIILAMMGIADNMNLGLTTEQEVLAAQIMDMTDQILTKDTEDINPDCFFSFDNKRYDQLLKKARLNHENKVIYGNNVYTSTNNDEVFDLLNSLDTETGTLNEITNRVKNTIRYCASGLTYTSPSIYNPDSYDPTTNGDTKFIWGNSIIDKFLRQTILQTVLQIFSPKVVMLFKINQAIMGKMEEETDEYTKQRKDIFENFKDSMSNLIVSIIKALKQILLEFVWNQIKKMLTELLQLFSLEVAKEVIADYRKLLNQLVTNCSLPNLDIFGSNNTNPLRIDNVNYADIIEPNTRPEQQPNNCG